MNTAWYAAVNGKDVPKEATLSDCAGGFQYLISVRRQLEPQEFQRRASIILRGTAARWVEKPIDEVMEKMEQLSGKQGSKRRANPYDGALLSHIKQALIEKYTPEAADLKQDQELLGSGAIQQPSIEAPSPAAVDKQQPAVET